MRQRSLGLTLFGGLAIIVAACGGGATPSPSASAPASEPPAASQPAASEPAASESAAPSVAQAPDMKVGVVTDIGTLNDKNFNEYSFKGAEAGATAVGAAAPNAVVPTGAADYGPLITDLIEQDFDVIVTVGFNLGADTGKAAVANPDVTFIGVDQSPICIKADGSQDFTFPCPVDSTTIAPNYTSLAFQEDQAGYLAGIVAAGASESGSIGAIGGTSICAPCVRYIQGYELGAKSVNPDIKVVSAYVTNDFSPAAFQDQAGGKTFAENFLAQNTDVDVIFQVAGLTGNGVLDAACAADIWAIGVDVDQVLSYPNAEQCLITSATKSLELAVSEAIKAKAADTLEPGTILFDAKADGIGVAPGHSRADEWAADTQSLVDAAIEEMKAGTLTTCPTNCGSLQ